MADFTGRPVGDLLLRGRKEPLRAYEPMTADAYAEAATSAYGLAFAKLTVMDPATIPAFAGLVGLRPDDLLLRFHLKRLLNGGSGAHILME